MCVYACVCVCARARVCVQRVCVIRLNYGVVYVLYVDMGYMLKRVIPQGIHVLSDVV